MAAACSDKSSETRLSDKQEWWSSSSRSEDAHKDSERRFRPVQPGSALHLDQIQPIRSMAVSAKDHKPGRGWRHLHVCLMEEHGWRANYFHWPTGKGRTVGQGKRAEKEGKAKENKKVRERERERERERGRDGGRDGLGSAENKSTVQWRPTRTGVCAGGR